MTGLKKGIFNTKCSKPVNQFDLKGNFIREFPSAREVQRQLGLKAPNVTMCCKGRIKIVGKYIFEYAG